MFIKKPSTLFVKLSQIVLFDSHLAIVVNSGERRGPWAYGSSNLVKSLELVKHFYLPYDLIRQM